jgi:hypothetical protein
MASGETSGVIDGEENVLVVVAVVAAAGVGEERERRWKEGEVLVFHHDYLLFQFLFPLSNSRLSMCCGRGGLRFHHCCR